MLPFCISSKRKVQEFGSTIHVFKRQDISFYGKEKWYGKLSRYKVIQYYSTNQSSCTWTWTVITLSQNEIETHKLCSNVHPLICIRELLFSLKFTPRTSYLCKKPFPTNHKTYFVFFGSFKEMNNYVFTETFFQYWRPLNNNQQHSCSLVKVN